jgi:hypothetical protein
MGNTGSRFQTYGLTDDEVQAASETFESIAGDFNGGILLVDIEVYSSFQ